MRVLRFWAAVLAGSAILAGCTTAPVLQSPSGLPLTSSIPSGPGPDFGDAPDPSFPTLLSSNGARTADFSRFWLGNLQTPSATAEADAKVVDRDELDDGLERVSTNADGAVLSFRAVKSATAGGDPIYFNLLVDRAGDGRWNQGDWVDQNERLTVEPGGSAIIRVAFSPASDRDIWLRAALTDKPVDAAAFPDGWDGTGAFAQGEIEDYRLRFPSPPTETPLPTETPYETPRASATPAATFVYTGDFVPICSPDPATVNHGETTFVHLDLTGNPSTPPERFSVTIGQVIAALGGQRLDGAGEVTAEPPEVDFWSPWGHGAGFTYRSTHVDGPDRIEDAAVWIVLQSRSTTRILACHLKIVHHVVTTASPQASSVVTGLPAIEVFPTTVHAGEHLAFTGSNFTPGGAVTVSIRAGPALNLTSQATADATGFVSGAIFLPPGLPPGAYFLVAFDQATGHSVATQFSVLG